MVNVSGGGGGRETGTIAASRWVSMGINMEVLLGLIQAVNDVEANDSLGVSNAASAYSGGNYEIFLELCSQNDGQYRSDVISFVLEKIKPIFCWIGILKWVTSAFLAIDQLSQVDQNLNADISELLKKEDVGNQNSLVIDDENQNRQLLSEAIHAVLQLCSTLTRTHYVAVNFLDAGGLPLLLSLPTSSLFVCVVAATNRQSNGRLTSCNLLLNMTFVISRDPVIFMRAARAMCQIETVGERPYVVLLKDREKDKSKEKEKEKPQTKTDEDKAVVGESSLVIDMEINVASSKGKGKTIALGSKEKEDMGQESFESLAKFVFILKLLKEILLMYGPSVHVLVWKNAEFSSSHVDGIFFPHSWYPGNDIQAFVDLFDDVLAKGWNAFRLALLHLTCDPLPFTFRNTLRPATPLIKIPKPFFISMIISLAAKEPSALGLDSYYMHYYLCLVAFAATIKWIEADKGVVITNHSSSVWTRLLRANLLQPLKDTINARLDYLVSTPSYRPYSYSPHNNTA
nr:hypothetical protein [Tanacetum cinerariifolium]